MMLTTIKKCHGALEHNECACNMATSEAHQISRGQYHSGAPVQPDVGVSHVGTATCEKVAATLAAVSF